MLGKPTEAADPACGMGVDPASDDARAEGQGRGAVFTITLPVALSAPG